MFISPGLSWPWITGRGAQSELGGQTLAASHGDRKHRNIFTLDTTRVDACTHADAAKPAPAAGIYVGTDGRNVHRHVGVSAAHAGPARHCEQCRVYARRRRDCAARHHAARKRVGQVGRLGRPAHGSDHVSGPGRTVRAAPPRSDAGACARVARTSSSRPGEEPTSRGQPSFAIDRGLWRITLMAQRCRPVFELARKGDERGLLPCCRLPDSPPVGIKSSQQDCPSRSRRKSRQATPPRSLLFWVQ